MKIKIVTKEHEYQGLYYGTVIHDAMYDQGYDKVTFRHNGKYWTLDQKDVEIHLDPKLQDAIPPTKPNSALDKQVSGSHYKECGIQPIEYIHANGLNYFQGNVVKYVTRYKDKAGKADLEKAIHYLELMIELEYGE